MRGNFKVGDVSVRVRKGWGGGGGLTEIIHVYISDDPMSSVNCTIITKWYWTSLLSVSPLGRSKQIFCSSASLTP